MELVDQQVCSVISLPVKKLFMLTFTITLETYLMTIISIKQSIFNMKIDFRLSKSCPINLKSHK